MPLTDERLREYAKQIISTEAKCIEWGAEAERSVELCVEELRRLVAESERLIPVSEALPPSSQDTFYLCRLTDRFMRDVYRLHRWDVVSGWYLNSFPHLYTHWKPAPENMGVER